MTTDSDRLAASGVPITLVDGRVVYLRYSMRSLKALEDSFGSLAAMQSSMNTDGKVVGPLMTVLAAGLHHENLTEDDLLDVTDPRLFNEYATALSTALEQAFPAPTPTNGEALGKANGSPGISSTTSAPFASVAPTSSSGA